MGDRMIPIGETSWRWKCRHADCDYEAMTIDAPRRRAEQARERHEATHKEKNDGR